MCLVKKLEGCGDATIVVIRAGMSRRNGIVQAF
jgi:hypothetical protein